METPTVLQIGQKMLRVTLFDANHCPGSTLFLFEGQGKAVIYTGDIRAEVWWVEWLRHHPVLMPYTMGTKQLDNLYLDTSMLTSDRSYWYIGTKAEACAQLISEMSKYPKDTVFHFDAWTFGYEEVWAAVAAHYRNRIHVNEYMIEMYNSVKNIYKYGPLLMGHQFESSSKEKFDGILTRDYEATNFHSCEASSACPVIDSGGAVVIVASEFGKTPKIQKNERDEYETYPRIRLPQDLQSLLSSRSKRDTSCAPSILIDSEATEPLSRIIVIPFSRHSSTAELRHLVTAFKPMDLYPNVISDSPSSQTVFVNAFRDLCPNAPFAWREAHSKLIAKTEGNFSQAVHPVLTRFLGFEDGSTAFYNAVASMHKLDATKLMQRMKDDQFVSPEIISVDSSDDAEDDPIDSQHTFWTSTTEPDDEALSQKTSWKRTNLEPLVNPARTRCQYTISSTEEE